MGSKHFPQARSGGHGHSEQYEELRYPTLSVLLILSSYLKSYFYIFYQSFVARNEEQESSYELCGKFFSQCSLSLEVPFAMHRYLEENR